MTVFKILQRQLTSVDLRVDEVVNAQYSIAKVLYFSFSNAKPLSVYQKGIAYLPYPDEYKRKLSTAEIDSITESLIERQSENTLSIKSIRDFEAGFLDQKKVISEPFSAIAELFLNFHPKRKPILWRMLIAQAHLYLALIAIDKLKMKSDNAALIHSNDKGSSHRYSVLNNFKLKMMSKEEWQRRFEWRKNPEYPEEPDENEFFHKPFMAVEKYLEERLPELMEVKDTSQRFASDTPLGRYRQTLIVYLIQTSIR